MIRPRRPRTGARWGRAATPRADRRVTVALTLTAVVLATGASAPTAPPPPPPTAGAGATFTPHPLTLSAPEIPNPLRGQFRWISNPPAPASWPAPDLYYRDEIQWGAAVEKERGQYDFSVFDRGLAEAAAGGGLFSFRVMAACPECGGNLTPRYVERQSGGQPDWNSESFLQGYADLMTALGARYDTDPRLGFVDVGGYGSWGEFHTYDLGGDPITRENAKRLVRSVLVAFPSKFVLMMTPGVDYLRDALELSPRVGIRVDCVGDDGLRGSMIDEVPEALTRWKTAPWVGEWCGDSDAANMYELALQQVREYHITSLSSANFPDAYPDMSRAEQEAFAMANKTAGFRFTLASMTIQGPVSPGTAMTVSSLWSNTGVGPAYLPWQTLIELRDPRTGTVAFTGRSRLELATFLPTGNKHQQVDDAVHLPPTLPPGTYDIHVRVINPGTYLPPLQLAITGRTPDWSYRLGPIQVGAARDAAR